MPIERVNELKQVYPLLSEILKSENIDLILLYGQLGAGKTYLVKKWLTKQFKIEPKKVVSPTFTILQEYELPKDTELPFKKIAHYDFYRLEGAQTVDLENISLMENMADSQVLTIVEWPDKIGDFNWERAIKIEIEMPKKGEEGRIYKISY